MKITEVSYSMKYSAQQSSGRWGGEEVTLVATVSPDENPEHAVAKLKLLCEQQLHGEQWRRNYAHNKNRLETMIDGDPSRALIEQDVQSYEAWANAVGDVRRELLV